MKIVLTNIGKRFRYDWIFKDFNFAFEQGQTYAILGPNGVGKSTLMKVLSGHLTPSKGQLHFFSDENKQQDINFVYRSISYAAPYIELVEEMTLNELLAFHQQFKPFFPDLTPQKLIQRLGFEHSANKEIRFFSSGMKQRLKLVLSICSDTPILLLDEPTTNLDIQGAAWYKQLLLDFQQNRLLIIASNVPSDYDFICQKELNILDYK